MSTNTILGRLCQVTARRRTRMLINALPPEIRRDIGWPEPQRSRLTTGWPHLWSL